MKKNASRPACALSLGNLTDQDSRSRPRRSALFCSPTIAPIRARASHESLASVGRFTSVSLKLDCLRRPRTLALLVARAKGTVLVSVVGHWSINAQAGIFFALLPAMPHDTVPGGVAYCLASVAVALVVAVLWRKTRWAPYGSNIVVPVV